MRECAAAAGLPASELDLIGLRALADRSDRMYQVYAARLHAARANPPPPDWNGVTSYDEK